MYGILVFIPLVVVAFVSYNHATKEKPHQLPTRVVVKRFATLLTLVAVLVAVATTTIQDVPWLAGLAMPSATVVSALGPLFVAMAPKTKPEDR